MRVASLAFHRKRGFVLIAMCACMFLLLASMGLAFDVGRIYIARNEGQVFADAAAMAAAQQLDGSNEGFTRAVAAAKNLPGRWNMAAETIKGVKIEFSKDGERWEQDWKSLKLDPSEIHLARVAIDGNELDITFLRAVGGPNSFNVPAHAVAVSQPVRLVE